MIEKIDKPALSALWPNKNGMNVVLDLGANIECNEDNLIDFAELGSALYKALFPNEKNFGIFSFKETFSTAKCTTKADDGLKDFNFDIHAYMIFL